MKDEKMIVYCDDQNLEEAKTKFHLRGFSLRSETSEPQKISKVPHRGKFAGFGKGKMPWDTIMVHSLTYVRPLDTEISGKLDEISNKVNLLSKEMSHLDAKAKLLKRFPAFLCKLLHLSMVSMLSALLIMCGIDIFGKWEIWVEDIFIHIVDTLCIIIIALALLDTIFYFLIRDDEKDRKESTSTRFLKRAPVVREALVSQRDALLQTAEAFWKEKAPETK